MPRGPRFALLTLFALLVLILVGYGVVLFDPLGRRAKAVIKNAPPGATLTAPTVSFIDPRRGNAHGTLTLVEFGDYQCSYCGQVEAMLNAALRGHPNLLLVWKDLPNSELHKESAAAALAARCAARQGKFWEYHDYLFENQKRLGSELYQELTTRLGLNAGKFSACLTNKEEDPIIKRNIEEAVALGVDGTPYFFLGELRVSGAVTPEEFKSILDRMDQNKKP